MGCTNSSNITCIPNYNFSRNKSNGIMTNPLEASTHTICLVLRVTSDDPVNSSEVDDEK